jgi:hypothetical protein
LGIPEARATRGGFFPYGEATHVLAQGAGADMLSEMMLAGMTPGGAGLVGRGFVGPGLVGLIVAISFSAGLNVYATTATLGLLGHTRWVELPPGLHVLTSWWVIGASLLLFGIEFFADKVPAFDLFWNALHTFVRIPVAALMAFGATSQLSPEMQLVATLAGGLIALAVHGSKTAARVAVTPSPEPVSNIALSTSEDAVAVFVTWLATRHPMAAGVIALAFLIGILAALRWIWRRIVHALRRFPEFRSRAATKT